MTAAQLRYDPDLPAEVHVTYDGDTPVLTFGNVEPSGDGWLPLVYSLRRAAGAPADPTRED